MQLFPRGGGFPPSAGGHPVDHAQQGADWDLPADLEPWVELLPRPAVHPDLPSLAALATPYEHSAAGAVLVALLERERFADPQTCTPEQHDQRAEAVAVRAIADPPASPPRSFRPSADRPGTARPCCAAGGLGD